MNEAELKDRLADEMRENQRLIAEMAEYVGALCGLLETPDDPKVVESARIVAMKESAGLVFLKTIIRHREENEQLQADVAFLARRSLQAGGCSFTDERDSGTSSNSIVAIAYGLIAPDLQVLPGDENDLAACERMWVKLPDHRKTNDAVTAMERARNYKNEFRPNSIDLSGGGE
jgi:hypothetical protein